MNHFVTGLRCVVDGKRFASDDVLYVSPDYGNEGILDVEYDYDAIRHALGGGELHFPLSSAWSVQGMMAYRPFLPVDAKTPAPPLLVGATPLYHAPRLAKAVGVADVWVKDDGRNPTASLKDRASTIAIMKAHELNADIVTTASTGNAAAALAGLAASVGQKTVIFVPASAPQAKIAQLLTYGATVMLVKGTYDDAFDLCLKATAEFGWYCRNTGYNPYMAEGKKTVTFEIYDQLFMQGTAPAQFPTHIFVSVGDGCIISGVHKGLRDLEAVGLLPFMPRIIGVQAAGSSYLYDAWRNQEDVLTKPPIAANTIADSISAGLPRDRIKAMRAVTETDGAFVQVTDEEILAAMPALAQGSGVFAEPAAAAAYAGLLKASQNGLVGRHDRALVLVTGNGLKDVASAMKAVADGQAATVDPQITAVHEAMQQIQRTTKD